MSVLTELLAFSIGREGWQQDMIRRLYTQAALSPADEEDALKMLKVQYNLADRKTAPTPVALTAADKGHCAPPIAGTILNTVHKITNCNRLAADQRLNFAIEGITLIYGDNGSGKSGYCRILKKICRVRSGAREEIFGDAFAEEQHPPATVAVRLSPNNGGPVAEHVWKDGDPPIKELSCVSVFDSLTAPLYANKENKIEFLPQGLDVLPRLGELCTKLGNKVALEIVAMQARIATPLPAFGTGTEPAVIAANLTEQTAVREIPTAEQVEAMGVWTAEMAQELADTVIKLNSDPQRLAQRCRQTKEAIDNLVVKIEEVEKTIGTTAVIDLCAKIEAATAARQAANLAAGELFANEPLDGVGGEPWRLMFEAAREYSGVAYPEEPFPVTAPNKHCLLCQQPITDEASDRLKRFDEFIQNKASDLAAKAEAALATAFNAINELVPAIDAESTLATAEELDPRNAGNLQKVNAYLIPILPQVALIAESYPDTAKLKVIKPLPAAPVQDLRTAASNLEELAKGYDGQNDPAARAEPEKKRANLEAKKRFHENLAAILTRRKDLLILAQLKMCKDSCNPREISLKNTTLRRQFLTKDFEALVCDEATKFALDYLPLKISDRSDAGTSLVGVDVDTHMDVRNVDILSEGEFRALALACFLADIKSLPNHAGIIVDDPVSSLDHLRCTRVANRLVEEATKRQVIIFTHDLCFYHDIIAKAAEEKVRVLPILVRKTEKDGVGVIAENAEPWLIKKVGSRLQALDERINNIRDMQDKTGEEYRLAMRAFYGDLRDAYERFVEEVLFSQVISRFHKEVKTLSLKGAYLDNDDFAKVTFGMTRASNFCHDRASGQQVVWPNHEEMRTEVQTFREYFAKCQQRSKVIAKEREALQQPPLAATA